MPQAHTIVLVDATDKLEPRHRKRLTVAIAQERARLNPYDRLSILALRPDSPQEPRLLFSKCLPRQPSLVNPLFENPAMAQEKWNETIGKALDAAVRRAAGGSGASVSPISASLRAAAADPDFTTPGLARRVVLISDLLENDARGYSVYRQAEPSEPARAALDGASVRVVTLDRPDDVARQDAAKTMFWTPFFAASGAGDVVWDAPG